MKTLVTYLWWFRSQMQDVWRFKIVQVFLRTYVIFILHFGEHTTISSIIIHIAKKTKNVMWSSARRVMIYSGRIPREVWDCGSGSAIQAERNILQFCTHTRHLGRPPVSSRSCQQGRRHTVHLIGQMVASHQEIKRIWKLIHRSALPCQVPSDLASVFYRLSLQTLVAPNCCFMRACFSTWLRFATPK